MPRLRQSRLRKPRPRQSTLLRSRGRRLGLHQQMRGGPKRPPSFFRPMGPLLLVTSKQCWQILRKALYRRQRKNLNRCRIYQRLPTSLRPPESLQQHHRREKVKKGRRPHHPCRDKERFRQLLMPLHHRQQLPARESRKGHHFQDQMLQRNLRLHQRPPRANLRARRCLEKEERKPQRSQLLRAKDPRCQVKARTLQAKMVHQCLAREKTRRVVLQRLAKARTALRRKARMAKEKAKGRAARRQKR
mmetsp:Transcript_60764/g.161429  ORF Transcript_60764/g.161429 Transcript_60764/m.161429 type:complete len:246 (+) Transcript_60764:202-939(+)